MDNWFMYVAYLLVGFSAGVIATAYDHQSEIQELETYRVVDQAMEDAGAHRWCELVLSGEIIPTEVQE